MVFLYIGTMKKALSFILFIGLTSSLFAQRYQINNTSVSTVGPGWAKNSVNTVIFRRNSLVTYGGTQYIAYYNSDRYMVLGKRTLGSKKWVLAVTPYKGDITDAHRSISIMTDGEGYLHIAWDHHNTALRYCRSIAPGSLKLTAEMPMTGKKEQHVTYPEFYHLPNGNLLFFYRDGSSGNGDLMLNHYDVKSKQWTQLQDGWINGEGQRNAYWQVFTDKHGTIHLSWVWRETGNVATNHDICYARSTDEGKTWEKSTGEKYSLPITQSTAEYAWHIPQNSELINSTSMSADDKGRPYIATYWREAGSTIPQYRLVYFNGTKWLTRQITNRKTPFTLAGGGTKRIPISRPQILVHTNNGKPAAVMIFRDEERGNKINAAICSDLLNGSWRFYDLSAASVGQWEPSYDTELWRQHGLLNIFVQNVEQADAEHITDMLPQPVKVLEWKPVWK